MTRRKGETKAAWDIGNAQLSRDRRAMAIPAERQKTRERSKRERQEKPEIIHAQQKKSRDKKTEDPVVWEALKESQRKRMRAARESPEYQSEENTEKRRVQARIRYANESEEKYQARLEYNRERRRNETDEQREQRLEHRRAWKVREREEKYARAAALEEALCSDPESSSSSASSSSVAYHYPRSKVITVAVVSAFTAVTLLFQTVFAALQQTAAFATSHVVGVLAKPIQLVVSIAVYRFTELAVGQLAGVLHVLANPVSLHFGRRPGGGWAYTLMC